MTILIQIVIILLLNDDSNSHNCHYFVYL